MAMKMNDRKRFRMTAIMIFVFGVCAGYIVGLWHQAAQKEQRIQDEKILSAGSRWDNNK